MTPGPNLILKTPSSGSLAKISSIASGNTFGAQSWTDGKREARMLPDEPWLRCNPHNAELFWTDECEEIGREELWDRKGRYRDVPFATEPNMEDYRRAITSGLANTREKERYIRMRCWWAANDSVRHRDKSKPSFPDFRDNLLRFRDLLDTSDPNQRLMAAEASRELRDFSKATELLGSDFPESYGYAVELIKKLTNDGDSTVRKVA
jgi:hypothetical protein